MRCEVWQVVGGKDRGGIVVRSGRDLSSAACPARLATGALIEELERDADRLRYRRLLGDGPDEGWIAVRVMTKELLARPAGLWEVVGGGDRGGILAREGADTASAALPARLATGALVRETALEGLRLRFALVVGAGPDAGWVSTQLADGRPLLVRVGGTAPPPAVAARPRDPYDGVELSVADANEERGFSYQGHPAWVRTAAAVAKLFREGRPYLPTRQVRPERLREPRRLAPFQRKTPKELEEVTRRNLPGCLFGMTFPKTAAELESDEFGSDWLTRAFHAAGTLAEDNRVTRIVSTEVLPVAGFDAAGGAAMKMLIRVEYLTPDPELHTDLFCKYPYLYEEYPSARKELSAYGDMDGPEITCQMSLAHLFPFRTAKFYFGEVCRETTNFILISERIPFSPRGRVEEGRVVEQTQYAPYQILPVCGKYQDWLLPNPAEYYCCLFRAMGRLAAWDKLGRYDEFFGVAPTWGEDEYIRHMQASKKPISAKTLESQRRAVAGVIDCGLDYMRTVVPTMVPPALLEEGVLERVKGELLEMCPFFSAMSGQYQLNSPDYVAAMHANLQADNAFFWRDEYDELDCGVLDWGGFSRVPFCMSFLGCLSGADPEVLAAHEEGIIRCFRDEYRRCGGPYLEMDELLTRYHLGYITFVYESATWVERDIYKQATREEIGSWSGVFDPRFQAAFRVRCRTMTIINAYALYHMRGGHFKAMFERWYKGSGARYLPEIIE